MCKQEKEDHRWFSISRGPILVWWQTLNIAHALHKCQVSFNFQLSFIIVPLSGPGGTGGWGRGGGEGWPVDRSFRSQAHPRQTETLCLGLAHWLCGWGTLSTGDGRPPSTAEPRTLSRSAFRKLNHQLPCIKLSFLVQLTSQWTHIAALLLTQRDWSAWLYKASGVWNKASLMTDGFFYPQSNIP